MPFAYGELPHLSARFILYGAAPLRRYLVLNIFYFLVVARNALPSRRNGKALTLRSHSLSFQQKVTASLLIAENPIGSLASLGFGSPSQMWFFRSFPQCGFSPVVVLPRWERVKLLIF